MYTRRVEGELIQLTITIRIRSGPEVTCLYREKITPCYICGGATRGMLITRVDCRRGLSRVLIAGVWKEEE